MCFSLSSFFVLTHRSVGVFGSTGSWSQFEFGTQKESKSINTVLLRENEMLNENEHTLKWHSFTQTRNMKEKTLGSLKKHLRSFTVP